MPTRKKKPGEPNKKPGTKTHFPNKSRTPYPVCLPPHLAHTLQRTADRLHMRRGDVICFLLQEYADKLDRDALEVA